MPDDLDAMMASIRAAPREQAEGAAPGIPDTFVMPGDRPLLRQLIDTPKWEGKTPPPEVGPDPMQAIRNAKTPTKWLMKQAKESSGRGADWAAEMPNVGPKFKEEFPDAQYDDEAFQRMRRHYAAAREFVAKKAKHPFAAPPNNVDDDLFKYALSDLKGQAEQNRGLFSKIVTQFGRGVADVGQNLAGTAALARAIPGVEPSDVAEQSDMRALAEQADPAHVGYGVGGAARMAGPLGVMAAGGVAGWPGMFGAIATQTVPQRYEYFKSKKYSDSDAQIAGAVSGGVEAAIWTGLQPLRALGWLPKEIEGVALKEGQTLLEKRIADAGIGAFKVGIALPAATEIANHAVDAAMSKLPADEKPTIQQRFGESYERIKDGIASILVLSLPHLPGIASAAPEAFRAKADDATPVGRESVPISPQTPLEAPQSTPAKPGPVTPEQAAAFARDYPDAAKALRESEHPEPGVAAVVSVTDPAMQALVANRAGRGRMKAALAAAVIPDRLKSIPVGEPPDEFQKSKWVPVPAETVTRPETPEKTPESADSGISSAATPLQARQKAAEPWQMTREEYDRARVEKRGLIFNLLSQAEMDALGEGKTRGYLGLKNGKPIRIVRNAGIASSGVITHELEHFEASRLETELPDVAFPALRDAQRQAAAMGPWKPRGTATRDTEQAALAKHDVIGKYVLYPEEWDRSETVRSAMRAWNVGGSRTRALLEKASPDFAKFMRSFAATDLIPHRDVVVKALAEGKPVPKAVLAEYPDLGPAASAAPPPPAEQPPAEPAGKTAEGAPEPFYSIQNAVVDEWRKLLGIKPVERGGRPTWDAIHAEATAALDADPQAGEKTVAHFRDNPHESANESQQQLIVMEQLRLKKRFEAEYAQVEAARASGTAKEIAEAEARADATHQAYEDATDVGAKVGSVTGGTLNARKMLLADDYSPAQWLKRVKLAKGRDLNPEETAKAVATAKKLTDLNEKAVAAETQQTQETKDARADVAIAAAKRKIPVAKSSKRIEAARAEADAAWNEFTKNATGKLFSNPLDPELLASAAKLVKAHIKLGVATLREFMEKVTERIGADKAKAAADLLARAWHAEKNINPRDVSQLSNYANELAQRAQERGIHGREPIVDEVHAGLQEVVPKITREEAHDALSRYGQFAEPSKEADKIELAQIRRELQNLSKLRDMQAGRAPLKTGRGQQPPSDEERRLIKLVNDAKKKGGFNVTDPERQLRSAHAAQRTRLENTIADLQHEITTRERILKEKNVLRPDAYNAKLKEIVAELRQQHAEIFGKNELTHEQRLALAIKADERSLAMWEGLLENAKEGIFRKKKFDIPIADSQRLEIRARRDEVKAEYQTLKDLADPKKTPEEIADQRYATYLENRAVKLKEKNAIGDYSKPPKKEPRVLSGRALRAKLAFERERDIQERGLKRDQLKRRATWEKWRDRAVHLRREFIFSSPNTVLKLGSAMLEGTAKRHLEEVAGIGISKLLPAAVAAGAPYEGYHGAGEFLRAETAAATRQFANLAKNSYDIIRHGKTDLQIMFDKHRGEDEFNAYMGRMHLVLKNPLLEAEFARSFEKGMSAAERAGEDVNNQFVIMRIGTEAYRRAEDAIHKGDNRFVDMFNWAVAAVEQPNKATGKPSLFGKAAGGAARIAFPVMRATTNLVAQAGEHALGVGMGTFKLARALRRGLDATPPAEFDLIMRHFKRGSLGAALLLLGYANADSIGGYYQRGRKDDDVKFGSIKLWGMNVPSIILHNPLLECLQIGATIRRVMDSKLNKHDLEEQGFTSGVLAAAAGLVEEMPLVGETAEIGKVLDPHQREAFVKRYTESLLVPQAVLWLKKHLFPNPPPVPGKKQKVGWFPTFTGPTKR